VNLTEKIAIGFQLKLKLLNSITIYL